MVHPAPEAIQPPVLLRTGEVAVVVVVLAIPCILHSEACAPLEVVVLRRVAVGNEADPHMVAPGDILEVGRSCFLAFLLLGLASRDCLIGTQRERHSVYQFDCFPQETMRYEGGVCERAAKQFFGSESLGYIRSQRIQRCATTTIAPVDSTIFKFIDKFNGSTRDITYAPTDKSPRVNKFTAPLSHERSID